MEQITFSSLQLIIDGKEPLMSLFKESSNKPYSYDKAIYRVSCEKIVVDFFGFMLNTVESFHIVIKL